MLFILKIKKFFRENPVALCVLGFQGLLLVSAGLLIQGNSLLADSVATYAYFSLVLGVVLQFIYLVRHERRHNRRDEG